MKKLENVIEEIAVTETAFETAVDAEFHEPKAYYFANTYIGYGSMHHTFKVFKSVGAAYKYLKSKSRKYSNKTYWVQDITDEFGNTIYDAKCDNGDSTNNAEIAALMDAENFEYYVWETINLYNTTINRLSDSIPENEICDFLIWFNENYGGLFENSGSSTARKALAEWTNTPKVEDYAVTQEALEVATQAEIKNSKLCETTEEITVENSEKTLLESYNKYCVVIEHDNGDNDIKQEIIYTSTFEEAISVCRYTDDKFTTYYIDKIQFRNNVA